nr:endonuclease Q family protein [Candidatus Sigynarchaeota archaeon]
MQEFNADFHIHGPRSIGVSKNMDLPNMVHGAYQKGLQLVATGDCFQPDWLKYLKENLEPVKGGFKYKDVHFILQTEVEDEESVHEIILMPGFDVLDAIKKKFKPSSSNIDHEWGGRPRVNLSPGEIVEIVVGEGGMVGPAHAFTPFKSIFRQGKFDNLAAAYGNQAKNVHFLELGLSANTDYADRISDLHKLTFMTNSDAHAPSPVSLGREFNTFLAEAPVFEEVELAITRKDGRKFTRNVGFDPRMGKYNVLFCKACRRRVLVETISQAVAVSTLLGGEKYDAEFIHHGVLSDAEYLAYLKRVNAGKVTCPACTQDGKKSRIMLGVSDRVRLLADRPENEHPPHRAKYITVVSLAEMLRVAMGIGSSGSKSLEKVYDDLVAKFGTEINLLLSVDLKTVDMAELQAKYKKHEKLFKTLVDIIQSFRENKISFKPGGGGTFGELVFDE